MSMFSNLQYRSNCDDKVLVTGGAGHIGSALIENLIELGYKEVTSLDNYSNGNSANHVEGCVYVSADTQNISKLFSKNSFDVIFHLGEYARVEQSFQNIDEVYQSNYLGTLEVFKFASAAKCRVIYSCSSAINSMNDVDIINSPYVISKNANKEIFNSYLKLKKLEGAIVYFSNVYGGNEKNTGENATVIAKFIKAKKDGNTVGITSPGTQTRNFTHIEDVISGLLLVYKYGSGDNYFIASDDSVSIIDIANKLGVNYSFTSSSPGNRKSSKVNSEKLKALGWTVSMDIDKYFKKIFAETKKDG